jgi:hypothetical protein
MKSKFHFINTLIIVLILSLGLVPLNTALADGPTLVSVSAPSAVNPGEQFTVDIAVEPGTAIAGLQFNLAFDPAVVTADSVAEGNLLSQGGASTYFSAGTIDNVAGTISGVAGVITTPGQSVAIPEIFAVITMTAGSQTGTSSVTLSEVIVGDINGQAVEISVANDQVPVTQEENNGGSSGGGGGGGGGLTFIISATDADDDELVYSATGLPDGASFDTDTQTFSWTPRYDQAEIYSVHFEVSDGDLTDSEDVVITITQLYDNWDVNGDSNANVLDMVLVGQHWSESGLTGWILEDTNEDGSINVLDLIIIGQHWTG